MLPEGFLHEDVIDARRPEEFIVNRKIRIVIKAPVFFVVGRNETGEGYEFLRVDIESRGGDGFFALCALSW